jgi:hypothetical protein
MHLEVYVSDTVEPVHGHAQVAHIYSMALVLVGVDSYRWFDAQRDGARFLR